MSRLPDFLIVGAPRSGTTALAQYLRGHDGVFIPVRKELNFFDRSEQSGRPLEWYGRQFDAARGDQLVGEATPTYLFTPEAPNRMAALIPEARLIALLRNPVDRAYSHYWLCRLLGVERRDFADAVLDELGGRALPGLEYLAYGRYLEQIERTLEHFPRTSLLVQLFDDLKAVPDEFFETVCRHIGADPTFKPSIVGERINTAQRPRSVMLWRGLERWRNSKRRGFRVARFISSKNSAPFTPPPMGPDVRASLIDHFAESTDALGAWLERDLSAWSD
ncbi:MAG: hypothetical protein QOI55_2082 [Actinomycetota bacterium]|nr:hypothetical protein [Actinomycetota bacterium]